MPDLQFYQPTTASRCSFTEQKSTFTGIAEPFFGPETLRDRVDRIRAEYPDATHVAHAYVCGTAVSCTQGCGDDGEPHGTAGRPILDAIGYSSVINVLVLVVRYFGGTRLGTGGLVRAYSTAARCVLDKIATEPLVERIRVCVSLSYRYVDRAMRLFGDLGVEVVDEEFAEKVAFTLRCAKSHEANLSTQIADLTGGSARLWYDDDIE